MTTILDAARRLRPTIAARAQEIETARRLPADLAAEMAAAGLFRMGLPREIGGPECDPATLLEAIEIIGDADASAGWCTMIAVTSGLTAAYLETDVARAIFSPAHVIAGGVFAPMGRAVENDDCFMLTGKWQWASGSANCHWLGGGALIVDEGAVRTSADGAPKARMLLFPASSATLIDSWHVAGLCGTGSGEMAVTNLRVPKSHSASIATDRPVARGALYAFPIFGLLALGIAAVMLGNAGAAIRDLVELAGGKKPQGSTRLLAERATAQATLAETVAKFRAARAFYYEAVDRAWRSARTNGEVLLDERVALRLAATHAVRTSAEATRAMCDLGGGSSVFLSSPLQRRFRDAFVGAQHMMIAPQTYELTGRALMGLKTDAGFL
ncbi:MAG: acyl-CoA dehydrogenase family protein [Hyphomicrobiales bacterium]|nr:acyl-CoA dehydrogenase family protein [Hyphomicrobiales bacterium]